jgi:hypothetical protein
MQMMVLWLSILSKASICLSMHDIMHKQTAMATFLVFFLLVSTIILTRVTTAINIAAKVMAPRAELKIHLYAVTMGFFP